MDVIKVLEAMDAIEDESLKKALSYRPVVVTTTTSDDSSRNNNYLKSEQNILKKYQKQIVKWSAIAACFCLLLIGAITLITNLGGGNSPDFVIEDQILISYTGTDKNVVIPDNVVCIADYAFKEGGNAELVETITLGKKVSTIEIFAFDGCTNLKTISVSEKNELIQIDNSAVLSTDGKKLIYLNADASVRSYTVPNGVERICSYAFVNSGLIELTLPESVTTLDSLAVIFNDTLEKVTLHGVTNISDRSFYHNIALKTVELPNVTVVGEAAFSGCTALESISLPNATEIKKDAFSTCVNLKAVDTPNVVIIGENAFYDCEGLTSLNFPMATSIGNAAFRGCSNLSTLNIQNATTLGDWFIAETNVSVLILPNITGKLSEFTFSGGISVELWGKKNSYLETFAKEYNYTFVEIEDIDLPTGFSPVNDYMYVSVNSVNVRSTPEMGDNVVGYLVLDQEINRVATDGTWSMFLHSDGKYRFVSNSCLSRTDSTVKPIEPTDKTYGDFSYIEQDAYIIITKYHGSAKDVLIPTEINGKPVEEIKSNIFTSVATTIESVQANSIKRISGTDIFLAHCYKLQSLQMNSLEILPSGALFECISLNTVDLKGVKTIGSNVFICGTFTELYLTKIESIADDAFDKSGIKTLHGIAGGYAQTWATAHNYGFVNIANDYTPTYPDETVKVDSLTYTKIYHGSLAATDEKFGYQGVSIAHDSTGKLYLYVESWDMYISTTFAQFEDYATEKVHTTYQTATAYGNYAWLIASNGNGRQTNTLSVLRIDKNNTLSYGQINLEQTRFVQGLYCSFSSEQDGKLIVYYSEQYQRCIIYETADGGITWNQVAGDITSAANRHENVIAAGFVNNNIGFISYEYVGEVQPNTRTYITINGGKTWNLWSVTLPFNIIQDGYGEVVEMEYDNDKLILTVVVHGGSFTENVYYKYTSSDNGSTWNLLSNYL